MKKSTMKLVLVMSAVAGLLAGCGGGGSDGVDNSAMTINLKPAGDKTVAANSSFNLNMVTNVRRASSTDTNSVAGMSWTLTPLNGETITPVLSNAACAGANISGVTGSCSTIVSIPQTVTTGKWSVIGTAKSTNGNQRSESFILSVDNSKYNLSAGNAQSVTATTGNTVFDAVLLTGTLGGTNGGKLISVNWTQTSGPATTLSNSGTLTPSFVPTIDGTYEFKLEVLVDDVTISATTTIVANPKQ